MTAVTEQWSLLSLAHVPALTVKRLYSVWPVRPSENEAAKLKIAQELCISVARTESNITVFFGDCHIYSLPVSKAEMNPT